MPTLPSVSDAIARASSLLTSWCSSMPSTIWSPTVCTGLNDTIGSWNTIVMSAPRIRRIRSPSCGSC